MSSPAPPRPFPGQPAPRTHIDDLTPGDRILVRGTFVAYTAHTTTHSPDGAIYHVTAGGRTFSTANPNFIHRQPT